MPIYTDKQGNKKEIDSMLSMDLEAALKTLIVAAIPSWVKELVKWQAMKPSAEQSNEEICCQLSKLVGDGPILMAEKLELWGDILDLLQDRKQPIHNIIDSIVTYSQGMARGKYRVTDDKGKKTGANPEPIAHAWWQPA